MIPTTFILHVIPPSLLVTILSHLFIVETFTFSICDFKSYGRINEKVFSKNVCYSISQNFNEFSNTQTYCFYV
jgi:hypothetical protein